MPQSILFVCLGNICRSPLAEGIAKELAEKSQHSLLIDSAGTGSWHIGEAPCTHSIKVAQNHHIDISKLKARQVSKEDFKRFDMVVALDQNNYEDLKRMGCANLYKLGSFAHDNADVPDPYFFEGFEGFEAVFQMIEEAVYALFKAKNLL